MAVAYDAVSTATGGGNSTSFTHTPVGTPTAVVVGITSNDGAPDITGVTYGGTSMTALGRITNGADLAAELFALANPSAGAQTVVVSLSAKRDHGIGCISFTGSDTSQTAWAFNSASGSSTTPSVNITSATDDMVVDCQGDENPSGGTAGAGQTERYDLGGTAQGAAKGSTEAGAASVTMSWTITSSAWVTTGCNVAAPSVSLGADEIQAALLYGAAQPTVLPVGVVGY